MTRHMRQTMLAIEAHEDRTGRAPTVAEIAAALGYAAQSRICAQLLIGLELRGFIRQPARPGAGVEILKRVSRFATYRFDDEIKEVIPMTPK